MTKRTIWCISKYASPPKYGVGARLYYVAQEFKKMNHDVLLISSDANHLATYPKTKERYNLDDIEGLKHLWIKTLKYERSASIKRFLSWFAFEFHLRRLKRSSLPKPDVVIVSSLSLLSVFYGVYLTRKYRAKLIVEIRDIFPLTLTEEFRVPKWNPMVLFLGWTEKYAYKKADLIVGTMPNLIEHVKKIINKERPVIHSPIGIHQRWFSPLKKTDEVNQLFQNNEKFTIGYAGSMGQTNALEPFIRVIESLKDNQDIQFVLVGAGDMKETYKERLHDQTNVVIGPRIDQSEIPYFLSLCDVLYLSTHDSALWQYGQSLNKMVDYMMAGKPIIASYSGYQSMLNEAGSGVFIPTNDEAAILGAIKTYQDMSEQQRREIGLAGQQWVKEHHDYQTIGRNYLNHIDKLFNENTNR